MIAAGGSGSTDRTGHSAGARTRLAKTVGVFTVTASAASQECVGGIDFVLVHRVEPPNPGTAR